MRIDIETRFNAGDKAWCIINGKVTHVVIGFAKYFCQMYENDKAPGIEEIYDVYPVDQPGLRLDSMSWVRRHYFAVFHSEDIANEALSKSKL